MPYTPVRITEIGELNKVERKLCLRSAEELPIPSPSTHTSYIITAEYTPQTQSIQNCSHALDPRDVICHPLYFEGHRFLV